jgi:hypothetical protein
VACARAARNAAPAAVRASSGMCSGALQSLLRRRAHPSRPPPVAGLLRCLGARQQLPLALAAVTALTLRCAMQAASDPRFGFFRDALSHRDHDSSSRCLRGAVEEMGRSCSARYHT